MKTASSPFSFFIKRLVVVLAGLCTFLPFVLFLPPLNLSFHSRKPEKRISLTYIKLVNKQSTESILRQYAVRQDFNVSTVRANYVRKPQGVQLFSNDNSIPVKCHQIQKYMSIKAYKNWTSTLQLKFNTIISHLRSAVEKQLNHSAISWQENLNRARVLLATAFKPIVNLEEFITLIGTFYTLSDALIRSNIHFFLYGGSAIGAYRHFGLIPWDDDVDIMISVKDLRKTRVVLTNVSNYSLLWTQGGQWKFYKTNLPNLANKPHRWPFVDLFFYEENQTHIWDRITGYKNSYVYPKKWIFPLQYRPFEGGLVPVPCNLQKVIAKTYRPSMCTTSYYFHKYETMRDSNKQADIHCSLIYDFFPFVFTSHSPVFPDCPVHKLKIGKILLQTHLQFDHCKQ